MPRVPSRANFYNTVKPEKLGTTLMSGANNTENDNRRLPPKEIRMFNFDYPKDMTVGRVSLEMSLKPFRRTDDAYIEKVCEELFDGWRELLQYADSVAVMFWTSDGSEILEYTGNPDDKMDWSRYIGSANPPPEYPPVKLKDINPRMDVHVQPCFYMEDPPVITYRDLARIIAAIKRVGREKTGKPIRVVETFDPGPEFAYSDFKFHRHTELNRGSMMSKQWIHCAANLKADHYVYAAYPNGIPEGLPFGRFLGEQFKCLSRDVGFDSIWLSNGFGFSLESWNWVGELFNGKEFNHKMAPEIIESIRIFWREFTAAVGTDMLIECRGSNLSTGMDIAAHGSPMDDIYKNNIIAPPNSPWAALNYRFGLELAGFMSHIAELPEAGYMFRYYPHDPWWHNSPWFDRYDSTPHDIYLPLMISRVDKDGGITRPMGINFLSADDTYGRLPRRCPIEITPHILSAYANAPDETGPLTWLYPFDHYCRTGLKEGKMERMFMDDWFIENAIDNTLPLTSVVSDRSFMTAPGEAFRRTILITPVPEADSILEAAVMKAIHDGQRILLFGNAAHASAALREMLGLVTARVPAEGELTLTTYTKAIDKHAEPPAERVFHHSLLSNGAVCDVLSGSPEVETLATVTDDMTGVSYAYATYNRERGVAYLRGSFPHKQDPKASLPEQFRATEFYPVTRLLRAVLAEMGLVVGVEDIKATLPPPILFVSRHNNAELYTTYSKNTTSRLTLNTPLGAPLPIGTEAILTEHGATFSLAKFDQRQCRIYLKQKEGIVTCERRTAEHPYMDQRIELTGLDHATVTFTPPIGARFELVRNGQWIVQKTNVDYRMSDDGRQVVVEDVTGTMMICWQDDKSQA